MYLYYERGFNTDLTDKSTKNNGQNKIRTMRILFLTNNHTVCFGCLNTVTSGTSPTNFST